MISRLRALLAPRQRPAAPPPPRDVVYDLYRHLFAGLPPTDEAGPPAAPGGAPRAHSLLFRAGEWAAHGPGAPGEEHADDSGREGGRG